MMRMAPSLPVAGFVGLTPASAQNMDADDMQWINPCVDDNAEQPGGTPEIVRAYCIGMNEQMADGRRRDALGDRAGKG
ncbi:MAG: hypothetical protein ACK4MF_07630 [Hyphomicrobiaceae bacterium]